MTTALNALHFTDFIGENDVVVVSRSVAEDAQFRLGAGDDILAFSNQGPYQTHGIDVWTGTGSDTVTTSNGDDTIYANGAGHKTIRPGNGADNVHLDVANIASSIVNLIDTDHKKDVVFFSGQEVNGPNGFGSHLIQNVGYEDQFKFKDYGHLFVHDINNSVPGALDYVTRGTFDGNVVAKFNYGPGIDTASIHPELVHDGVHHWTMTFEHHII